MKIFVSGCFLSGPAPQIHLITDLLLALLYTLLLHPLAMKLLLLFAITHITITSIAFAAAHAPQRIALDELWYAAESRNYPEDPDTLFVTSRGKGLSAYNITNPGQFSKLSSWSTTKAVEGQDRSGSLMVVAELGLGPDGPFDNNAKPMLHLLDVSLPLAPELEPFVTLDLSPFIDGVLHVKFLRRGTGGGETWAAVTGGFATTTQGALVLVNLTRAVNCACSPSTPLSASEVVVVSTPILQPEGVLVQSGFVYIGGIKSSSLCVVNATEPASPSIVSTTKGVGMQLVAATKMDQPRWPSAFPYDDADDLVFMAGWGSLGRLVVLNASKPEAPKIVADTSTFSDVELRMSNRMKLVFKSAGDGEWDYDVALIPLEQRAGGFAVIDLSSAAKLDGDDLQVLKIVHVPLSELENEAHNSKSYCLAVSSSRHVYVFIAESSAVYIYDLDEILNKEK